MKRGLLGIGIEEFGRLLWLVVGIRSRSRPPYLRPSTEDIGKDSGAWIRSGSTLACSGLSLECER